MYPPTSADVGARPLRAARANRVFCTDEKRIRTENTVLVNTKHGAKGGNIRLSIARRRFFVRAKSNLCNNGGAI
jgi:hypothetical protein